MDFSHIDVEKLSWKDIAYIIDVGTIRTIHEKEESALYAYLTAAIRKVGPEKAYKDRHKIRNYWERILRPGLHAKWSQEEREQRRKAARKKRNRTFIEIGPPPERGILKRMLYNAQRKKADKQLSKITKRLEKEKRQEFTETETPIKTLDST
jgi:hypothetical protein